MERGTVATSRKCLVCEEAKTNGITICEQFICETCEREMIQTDVQEPKYPVFVKQLRGIWLKDSSPQLRKFK